MTEREPKWFIRSTVVDKANGPIHNMVTTHGSYAQAAHHLLGSLGAEKAPGAYKHYSKGKVRFDILPLKPKNGEPMKKSKSVRTEALMEDVAPSPDNKPDNKRDKMKIIGDAAQRVKEKQQKDKGTTKKSGKTDTGEIPNEIDMDPTLDDLRGNQKLSPTLSVSPGAKASK